MNQYNKIFDIIFKHSKNKKKEHKVENKYNCEYCGNVTVVDTQSANIVCPECGIVAAFNVIEEFSYKDRENHNRVVKNYNYSRVVQFNKYIQKKPYINNSLKKQLNNMFHKLLPLLDMKKFNRINFIRYEYIIFKFLELLDEKEICKRFSLPKSKIIIYKYDLIWKQLCKKLNWPFINSVCIMCVIEEKKYDFDVRPYVTIY